MDGLSLNENKERGCRVKSKEAVIAILWVLYVTCMGGVRGDWFDKTWIQVQRVDPQLLGEGVIDLDSLC